MGLLVQHLTAHLATGRMISGKAWNSRGIISELWEGALLLGRFWDRCGGATGTLPSAS
jgi:hypothetical protein